MQNMLANLRARREDDESGFTLIELMVVVLIIAILIAIAIPTFLGAKSRAQDKAAQSSLRNALTNAKGIYTDQDSYGATATLRDAVCTAAEPSLQFVARRRTRPAPRRCRCRATARRGLVMTAKSSSGLCFAIGDSANGPGTVFANLGKTTVHRLQRRRRRSRCRRLGSDDGERRGRRRLGPGLVAELHAQAIQRPGTSVPGRLASRRIRPMRSRANDDDGFTMIELMVVIGIVGVLIAIMIPTLLQARRPAQDRQAQNLLRNSLTAAKTIETSEGATVDSAALAQAESAVDYVGSTTTAPANHRRCRSTRSRSPASTT